MSRHDNQVSDNPVDSWLMRPCLVPEVALIVNARCPHCLAAHVTTVQAIGSSVRCPECDREHPVHPKAESVTEGLLAAILEEQRSQSAALGRLELGLYTLRLIVGVLVVSVGVFIATVLISGVRITPK